MSTFVPAAAYTFAAMVALAAVITMLPRLGRGGRWVAGRCARVPGLDLVVAAFTWVPWLAAGLAAGWAGFGGALVGQVAALFFWVLGHELLHPAAARGPRIVKAHNRIIGRIRNHAGLWLSVPAVPVFWGIRIGQILLYPPMQWVLDFPRYRHGDWINVTRHKFDGLVGHDLIWCLYCDWMTGIYALGGEMLRNVESFWCPLKFLDATKCANCRVDFPDIEGGWVDPDGTMAELEAKVMTMYGQGERSWFGHPARLTVNGAPLEEPAVAGTGEAS